MDWSSSDRRVSALDFLFQLIEYPRSLDILCWPPLADDHPGVAQISELFQHDDQRFDQLDLIHLHHCQQVISRT